jgi:hypothetical protein
MNDVRTVLLSAVEQLSDKINSLTCASSWNYVIEDKHILSRILYDARTGLHVLLLLLLFIITSMHGIYNYVPETNPVSMAHRVAAVLYLQFVLHVMLFFMLNVLYFYNGTSQSLLL